MAQYVVINRITASNEAIVLTISPVMNGQGATLPLHRQQRRSRPAPNRFRVIISGNPVTGVARDQFTSAAFGNWRMV
jgi:hypothetical protein